MKNYEIYEYAKRIKDLSIETPMPVKISFYIQKNKKTLLDLGAEIEESLFQLYNKYGEQKDSQMFIPQENIKLFQKEFDELMDIEQNIHLYIIKLEEIDDTIQISPENIETILFMIEE